MAGDKNWEREKRQRSGSWNDTVASSEVAEGLGVEFGLFRASGRTLRNTILAAADCKGIWTDKYADRICERIAVRVRHNRHVPVGPPFRPSARTCLAHRYSTFYYGCRARCVCLRGELVSDHGGSHRGCYWWICCVRAILDSSDCLLEWSRGRRRHCIDQFDRKPGGFRRSVTDRLGQGIDRKHDHGIAGAGGTSGHCRFVGAHAWARQAIQSLRQNKSLRRKNG